MPSPLRRNRRSQTAREIQLATLRLAQRHGFESVTTGMIAAEAKVSLRTFFNYYTNKEAAAVGEAPDFSDDVADSFVRGTGTLLDDLAVMLCAHLAQEEINRTTIRDMITLAQEAPGLMNLFEESLRVLHLRMVHILSQRLNGTDARTLDLLGQTVIAALRQSVQLWVEDDALDISASVDATLARLATVGQLISGRETPV